MPSGKAVQFSIPIRFVTLRRRDRGGASSLHHRNLACVGTQANLNDSKIGPHVITVAVERRRRPGVLFSVATPYKPSTDQTIDHGLQKRG